jgi:hypothetical protein
MEIRMFQKFRKIDDRTIYVENTAQLPVFADKPEPPREDPALDRIDRKVLMSTIGAATDADLELAFAWGLPSAIARRTERGGRGSTPLWSRKASLRWLDGLREVTRAVKL